MYVVCIFFVLMCEKNVTFTSMKKLAILSCLLLLSSCSNELRSLQKELQLQTLEKGLGQKIKDTDQLDIYETVTLKSGKLVYEHQPPKAALRINLGKNQLIKGLEYGLIGRREGEKFSMIIPVKLSQRKNYPDHTPRDSMLYYTVRVVKIIR
jgi:FKBP-type peptidyl-prolyl cis-trans isomerase